MKNNAKQRKKLPNIILALFFLVGLCIFLYPFISDFITVFFQHREIEKYENLVSNLCFDEYEKVIKDAQEYNESLTKYKLEENSENTKNNNYNELLSLDKSGIMGYLKIDKINVKLPIYHGTGSSVLQKGIGHLEGSSLPVLGKSTHTVLSGHTGLPSSKLLTDLDKLQIGDVFRIDVLNQVYTYEVDQILVVDPEETEYLEIVDDKQYATLITCTPYGVNTHRLLVRGTLKNNEISSDIQNSDAVIVDLNFVIIIVSITCIVFVLFVCILNKRRGDKVNDKKDD